MDVERTPLPGIGMREDFVTRLGRRLGVISHRDGRFELLASDQVDPDSCAASLHLTQDEATTLAGLLGAPPPVAPQRARPEERISTKQFGISAHSRLRGQSLETTGLLTEPGACVAAVVRAGVVYTSPDADFVLATDDFILVAGTAEGLAAATAILGTD